MLCSFVIPTYNAANTIVCCLDSIYALAFKVNEFEVIIKQMELIDNIKDIFFN